MENWIHIRESIDRHIRLLEESDPQKGSPYMEFRDRKLASLMESRRQINQEISDLQFEAETNLTSHIHDTTPD